MSTPTFSARHMTLMSIILLSILPILGMAIDLVAPSLPHMVTALHATPRLTKQVIFYYLIGYAIGNFTTGFLGDAWGRRHLLRLSLLGFTLSSFLPIFYPSINILLIARVLQGISIGAASVLMRAIFIDLLPPERLARLGTIMGTLWGIGPVIGPSIGGYLQHYFGWQAGFYFFGITGLLILIPTFFIVPETIKIKTPLSLGNIKTNIKTLLACRLFIGMSMLMGLFYSLIICFNTLGPFLIQTQLHYTAIDFGHMAMGIGVVFLLATFVSRFLLRHYTTQQIFIGVINLTCSLCFLLFGASFLFKQSFSILMIVSALIYAASGIIYPLAMAGGMSLFRNIAATATAVIYIINIFLTSLSAYLFSLLHLSQVYQLLGLYCIISLISVMVFWLMVRES